ncbi:PAS domain-containing protein [Pelagibius litoralis]|uniref:PAS domain-containing protein n=1 Tax=Pelagibius litoralis TaxID=374515 RepID=A0A967EX04_9PROT|nr:PAS domain-containing protein [Pelagibius litoralis]NIA67025.1 PAS domain-containing protein [Pelagibius litoralis]
MPEDSKEAKLTVFRLHEDGYADAEGEPLADCPEVLLKLHDYWQSRRGEHAFPARADIDPVDIPALLEHLLLVDVLEDPLDFRYRLVGGHIVHHAGHNIQGKTVRGLLTDGNSPEQVLQAKAMDLGKMVSDLKEPIFAQLRYHSVSSDAEKFLQMVLLPLGDRGRNINMLLAGLNYSY